MAELLDPSGNQLPTVSAAVPITVASLPPVAGSSDITLPPSAPSEYLRQMAGITLAREGFEGAEAGALSEVERLLENRTLLLKASRYTQGVAGPVMPGSHNQLVSVRFGMEYALLLNIHMADSTADILDLFRSASEYAELANRLTPNAADLLSAQEEVGGERDITSLQRESRESKRRRIGILPSSAPLSSLNLVRLTYST